MSRRFDQARFYYWHVELIEPDDPDDDCYVMLHGDDGEIIGPLTVPAAQAWINLYDGWRFDRPAVPDAQAARDA